MSVRRLFLLLLCCTLLPMTALAADPYNYISAAALEARLTAKEPIHLVDIQVEEEFAKHHITGATATFAYPVKTDAEKAKIQAVLTKLQADNAPVVVVCPRGAGGATRTYDYLLSQGIAAERLLILEKGQEGWTCTALTEGE
ncbi:MAG: rhodanese-like domain-containing protein [Desulfuromonadales bacterium]|nr:rhodanese-like domain-containing protein [Desulfuromonadales bacterium]